MSWTDKTFVGCETLTFSEMQAIQNNPAAMAAQNAGAPVIIFPNSVLNANAGIATTGVGSYGTILVGSGIIAAEQSSFGSIDVASAFTLQGGTIVSPPTGGIMIYGAAAAPSGWLLCDGTSYLRTAQQPLFDTIGAAYGAADGTHFNVPDFEGRFLRGRDNGAGRDPDAAGRTAMATGGATGDNIGSIQADAFKSHTHPQDSTSILNDANSPSAKLDNLAPTTRKTGGITQATGGSETRPLNAYVNYIIKT